MRLPCSLQNPSDPRCAAGQPLQMVVDVPKSLLERNQPLEVVTHLVLLRHADPAMQLDPLLAHDAAGVRCNDLCRRDRGPALGSRRLDIGKSPIQYRAGLLYFDEHLRQAMLQCLEPDQWLGKLLPAPQVLGGELPDPL